MLIKVALDSNAEIVETDGKRRFLLKVKYYSAFATALHAVTVPGDTVEDFHRNSARASKTLFVGTRGGLSLD